MKFTKMQGLGNDYVYVNTIEEKVDAPGEVAKMVSDRHFGIGADGLILIGRSEAADFSMDMYNADGSRGNMCGNGIRCVAKYIHDKGLSDKDQLAIETLCGIKYINLTLQDGVVALAEVDMGEPEFEKEREVVEAQGEQFLFHRISMGNPHAVIFIDDVENFPLEQIGPQVEMDPLFPERVNAEFCKVIDRNTIQMRVWERGSGETLACGTGACATAVAGALNGLTEDEVTIKLLGGDLFVKWDRDTNRVFMTGPAEFVFDGEIEI
ncbi:diaminopimelate epimerase [Lachnospiraceae bacterium OttesenSCG-928-E19]|nr:diaminopimelate epimerase [Lachnospiraceae bacterium OttesenSCG-928-E19]